MGSHYKRIKTMANQELINELQRALQAKRESVQELERDKGYTCLLREYPHVVYSTDFLHYICTKKSENVEEGTLKTIDVTYDPSEISEYNEKTAKEIAEHYNKENPHKHFIAVKTGEFEKALLEKNKQDIKMLDELIIKLSNQQ